MVVDKDSWDVLGSGVLDVHGTTLTTGLRYESF